MTSNWRRVKLSSVADEITVGYVGSMTTEYIESGVPFLRSKNVSPFTINLDDMKYISVDFHEKISKSKLAPGDVVIVRTGKPGTCSVIPEWLEDANCSDLVIVRCGREINNKFLAYYVNTIACAHVNAHLVGAVQQHFNVGSAKTMEVMLPPMGEQLQITHILGTLDDKIELNRQINTTLESMAQALFKSWFVDFDPVIDNALAAGSPIPEPLQAKAAKRQALRAKRKPLPKNIQQQFPDRFVFTEEMGWVPEGWEVGSFGDVARHIRENVKADDVADFECYVGLEHIGRKQLFLTDHSTGDSIESNKSKFLANDILFGKLRAYFHKVCLAPKEGICSTDILIFRAKQAHHHSFVTMTAYSSNFVEYADLRSTGTRMPRSNAKDLLSYPIILPPKEIGEAFESQLGPLWRRGNIAVTESGALEGLRDTLLPKLLSGEIRIPEAELQVAEAT